MEFLKVFNALVKPSQFKIQNIIMDRISNAAHDFEINIQRAGQLSDRYRDCINLYTNINISMLKYIYIYIYTYTY